MELINKYVQEVIKHLPQKKRNKVKEELIDLIVKKAEKDEIGTEEERIEKVIAEMGDPSNLAEEYREGMRYLIGPKVFSKYLFILKIVTCAMFVGISVTSLLGLVFLKEAALGKIIGGYISSLISAEVQGFAFVTIIFAFIEYNDININVEPKKKHWSIDNLRSTSSNKGEISKTESIFGILFSTIFFILLYFKQGVFSVYIGKGTKVGVISLFNLDGISTIKFLLILIFLLAILGEGLKLYWGRWNIRNAIISGVLTIINTCLTLMFLLNKSIWNKNFFNELEKATNFANIKWIENLNINNLLGVVVLIVLIGTIIEITLNIYKGVKYGREEHNRRSKGEVI